MRKRNRFFLLFVFVLSMCNVVWSQIIVAPQDEPLPSYTSQHEVQTADYERTTTYYDLGCKHQGLVGYFDPVRWAKTIDFGDGGVDVTEAPNATEVEGAPGARLEIQTGSSVRYTWSITVPADGYMFFRLEKVGSFLSQRISSTDTDLELYHNDLQLEYRPLRGGDYFSPLLEAGDIFSISFTGPGLAYVWNSFIFYSNGVGVIVREEGGKDPITGKIIPAEVEPILKAEMDQIFFSSVAPETWPTLDQDADHDTYEDQILLTPDIFGQQPFKISYQDRIARKDGQYWIARRFLFEERCSGNTVSIERLWQPLPVISIPQLEDIR